MQKKDWIIARGTMLDPHTHKTVAFLQVSVAVGAILSGANTKEVRVCELFALNIGFAFQVP